MPGDRWRYWKGILAPPVNWNARDFKDSKWPSGPSGFGYGGGDDATRLGDMEGNYVTVYIRKAFPVSNPDAYASLRLTVDYDGGFVAYLNGTEVARRNMSGSPPTRDTLATGFHATSALCDCAAAESFDLSGFRSLLVTGTNVLSIEGHNASRDDPGFSLIPSFSARGDATLVAAPGSASLSDACQPRSLLARVIGHLRSLLRWPWGRGR